jgi:hypothetical protein
MGITGERWDNQRSSHSGLATAAAFAKREVSLDMLSSASNPSTAPRTNSVYKYFDAQKILIYVGITSAGALRNRQHNSDKAWWPFVAEQSVEHFDSRDMAHACEVALIQRYRPPFNIQHNPDHKDLRAAYIGLHQSGRIGLDFQQLVATGEKKWLVLHPVCGAETVSFMTHVEDRGIAAVLQPKEGKRKPGVFWRGAIVAYTRRSIEVSNGIAKIDTDLQASLVGRITGARARIRYVSLKAPFKAELTQIEISTNWVTR